MRVAGPVAGYYGGFFLHTAAARRYAAALCSERRSRTPIVPLSAAMGVVHLGFGMRSGMMPMTKSFPHQ